MRKEKKRKRKKLGKQKAFSIYLKFWTIDAQSFSNSFEVVHGVVRKSGRGSSIFVFNFIFMLQFFKVFWGGTWGSPPPVCIYDLNVFLFAGCKSWGLPRNSGYHLRFRWPQHKACFGHPKDGISRSGQLQVEEERCTRRSCRVQWTKRRSAGSNQFLLKFSFNFDNCNCTF